MSIREMLKLMEEMDRTNRERARQFTEQEKERKNEEHH